MHVDARELAWAAGLFEAEGSIHLSHGKYARMSLAMSDEDSVRRFHEAVGGVGVVGKPYLPAKGNKYIWKWSASYFEHAQAAVAYLWYGLGLRRRDKTVEVLSIARNHGTGRITGGPKPRKRTPRPRCPRDPLRCKRGHFRTEENTFFYADGRKQCKPCGRMHSREAYRRKHNVPETAFRKRLQ